MGIFNNTKLLDLSDNVFLKKEKKKELKIGVLFLMGPSNNVVYSNWAYVDTHNDN